MLQSAQFKQVKDVKIYGPPIMFTDASQNKYQNSLSDNLLSRVKHATSLEYLLNKRVKFEQWKFCPLTQIVF